MLHEVDENLGEAGACMRGCRRFRNDAMQRPSGFEARGAESAEGEGLEGEGGWGSLNAGVSVVEVPDSQRSAEGNGLGAL